MELRQKEELGEERKGTDSPFTGPLARTWPTVQRGQGSNRGLDGEETHGVLEVWQRLQVLQGPHGWASTRQGY